MLKQKMRKNKIIRKIYIAFQKIMTIISPVLSTKISYRIQKGKRINLKNPKTLDEKISWLKLYSYNNDKLISQCADKYLVRKYVENRNCGEILNDLLFVYDHENQINWDDLPNQFALKWNFGCDCNIITNCKSKLDIKDCMIKLKKWRKTKYHLPSAEMQYKHIPHKLICEKYLQGANGNLPEDYKVYCFNGKAKFVMVCVDRDKGYPKFYFFDKNWIMHKLTRDSITNAVYVPKPNNIDLLFEYAEKLAQPFPFVRADFYLIDGKIYFGELTFTPCGGVDSYRLKETDEYFGSLLNIDDYTRRK